MSQEVIIPCGRYDYNLQTKKVVMIKAKGQLKLILNDENELWLRWYNQDNQNQIEIERVLIKGSTMFEKVKGQNRVYLLKFTDDDQKYFFWMQNQDPNQDEIMCKQFNDLINMQVLDDLIELEQQPTVLPQSQPQLIQQPQNQPQQQINQADFTNQLMQLLQQSFQPNSDLTLNDILTSEFLLSVASDPEYFEALKQHLPEDQQNIEQFKKNLLSPQFKQALEQLTHALKGRERSSVIQQLELDYRILEKEFDGVVAFIKAIIQQINKK